jgi:hypothetical protein
MDARVKPGHDESRTTAAGVLQSAETPLALIGPLQRAISPATNLAK